MASSFGALGAVDAAALGLLALFFVHGVIRGFSLQCARFVMILGGMACATLLNAPVAAALRRVFRGLAESDDAVYVAYFVILAGFFFSGHLAILLVDRLLKNRKVKLPERFFGGIAGGLTGAVVVLLCYLFLQLVIPQDEQQFWNEMGKSRTAHCADWALGRSYQFTPGLPMEP